MNTFQKRLAKIVDIVEGNNYYHIQQETIKEIERQQIDGLSLEGLLVSFEMFDKYNVSRYKIKKTILKELKENKQVSVASICNKLNIKMY